ncbi:uncharacterized protein DUF1328 [Haloarcula quadrata]|jgi:uncharacterized membrane protein YtjA (UPF0391 family)|uniref:UPF0391 membrane protein E6P14_14560 n=2 Tax=Haloarcula TaxID=2237 RepID=A0A4P8K0Q6_HALMA|nr:MULTISPECIES: DUF1328 family protein [Haloarcula]AAV47311.1 unknown [Haloarcula marismortui ATCC 43049]NHN64643.1 DUF1328 domain-containing protein [Haloarcula sp. JP-Z28]NHX39985.1 DUF1328 domain-containing protein [Haloarcula sp. R1-2]QCP92016.1 DUF1328 domain-containing protein [Haloarcula marismortui ATCC 43049]RKS81340.1 uncharacterized protein DUF1328 [Haloarcula quadrata]
MVALPFAAPSTVTVPLQSGGGLLYYAVVLVILAVVAGIAGFRGIAGLSFRVAKFLIVIFLVLALVTFLL